MHPNQLYRLSHSLNKSIGEWEVKLDKSRFQSLAIYRTASLLLFSFPWARLREGKLESKMIDRTVDDLYAIQEMELDIHFSFASLKFDHRYFIPGEKGVLDSWINNAIQLDIFNEVEQNNHPFIALQVYPRLYKEKVHAGGDIILLGQSAKLNKDRFNNQFKAFLECSKGSVMGYSSELGYDVDEKGIK